MNYGTEAATQAPRQHDNIENAATKLDGVTDQMRATLLLAEEMFERFDGPTPKAIDTSPETPTDRPGGQMGYLHDRVNRCRELSDSLHGIVTRLNEIL